MKRLELRLLGFPEFHLNGRRVELALCKAAALLIILAEAGGPWRATLRPRFCGQQPMKEAARACLRRTLYKIRIAFGSEVIADSISAFARPG